MAVIQFADAANALQRPFVAQATAQRIGRVCGVGNDAATEQDLHRLPYQPRLGVIGVYGEKLTQSNISQTAGSPLATAVSTPRSAPWGQSR